MQAMPHFDAEAGLLDRAVFASCAVYDRELRSIFEQSWLFVAPERRVAAPGAFVSSCAGEQKVLVWRGADSRLRAFFNRCPRGETPICDDDAGTALTMRCRCHGTSYASDGSGSGSAGLVAVAGLDCHRGLVFATLDECAPPLSESLSTIAPLLDDFVIDPDSCDGAPLRWMLDANWKLPAEAFAATAVFPNLSFDTDSGALLVWHPRGPRRTEVHLHCLVNQAAGPTERRDRQRDCQFRFGPNGLYMQRYSDAWNSITAQAGHLLAGRVAVTFPLPGEDGQRAFYAWWQKRLQQQSNARLRHMVAVS